MSLLKYLLRFERMHNLISRKSTGSCEEFAEKMNMSRSQLLQCISDMRQFGAPIKFCPERRCYTYYTEWSPFLNNKIKENKLRELNGMGSSDYNIILNYFMSPILSDYAQMT